MTGKTKLRNHAPARNGPRQKSGTFAPAPQYVLFVGGSPVLLRGYRGKVRIFGGWTLDVERREFRKVDTQRGVVILPLDSDEGRSVLTTHLIALRCCRRSDGTLGRVRP